MSTRPVPSTAARILDVAETEFAARGYDAASLGDIADRVGIRTASLYKHFGSKRDLYIAVVHRLLDPYFRLLGELLAVPNTAAQAERNLETVLDHYFHTPNLARLVQHAALAEGEALDLLVKKWYGPLFRRAGKLSANAPYLARGRRRDATWLVSVFHSTMSGYLTMAALHARVTGQDPLHPRARDRFSQLLAEMARTLWREATRSPSTSRRRR